MPFHWILSFCFFSPLCAETALPQSSSIEVLDRYDRPLRTVLTEDETYSRPVSIDDISPWLVLATLAAEDKRFYIHPGVDPKAVVRAVWQNLKAGRTVSGGSTISTQLVRALNPRPRTLSGKLAETWDALVMERKHDKRTILEGYLNSVSYGTQLTGAEAAARTYFEVPARDLSLAQSALLAGVPQSPTRLDPRMHPKAAQDRMRRVLSRMRDWGWLDAEAHRLALAEGMRISPRRRDFLAPHFARFILRRAQGTTIRTTLDADLQESFSRILPAHLKRLAGHHVTNGAMVALDNVTGEVLAWVGSSDFSDEAHQGQVDGVTALRQPGSALKPFAYGAALARGMRVSDILQDTPAHFPGGFTPKNYDEAFHGPVRFREALACSYNVPAARIAERLGLGRLLDVMLGFGLESLRERPDYYGLGLVLGNGEVTLLELAGAYAALARGGVWKPAKVLRGEVLETPVRRSMDRESAYLITSVLSDNAARASAFGLNSPLHMPFQFAAKTGTTKDYRDNWAMGYTPDWTVGVWVGNFDGKPMRRVSGISGAAPILHDAADVMEARFGSRPFEAPATIREAEVCPDSGLLPGPWCPGAIREVFAARNLPRGACDLHKAPASVAGDGGGVRVEFPKAGDVFKLDPRAPRESQAVLLRAVGAGDGAVWIVDGRELPERGESAWWQLSVGRHRVRVGGAARAVDFKVVP